MNGCRCRIRGLCDVVLGQETHLRLEQAAEGGLRSLFKSLGKTLIHAGTLEWTKAASAATDALSTVGLDEKPGELAWVLIHRALVRALFALVGEQQGRLRPGGEEQLDTLAESIDLSLEDHELQLDANLFEHPQDLTLLEDLRAPLAEWLIGAGLGYAGGMAFFSARFCAATILYVLWP